jgi:protein gp37
LEGKLAPAARRKPAVVGVEFTGELFDPQRPPRQIFDALNAAVNAPQHEFVFLTRQYELCANDLGEFADHCVSVRLYGWSERLSHWHIGTTCQTQDEYEFATAWMSNLGWNWWVSAEPLVGPISPTPGMRLPEGIIIGADNQHAAPYDTAWIRQTAAAFAAAGVKVYIKQLWQSRYPRSCTPGDVDVVGRACPHCGSVLHRKLYTDPVYFPLDLRERRLPWTLKTKGGQVNA